jgi:hypothetical protein
MEKTFIKPAGDNINHPNWLEVVQQQVGSLRFGVVQITVHDSRVVQIETTERLRFDKPQPDSH